MGKEPDLVIAKSGSMVLEAFLKARACVIVPARLDDLRPFLTDLRFALRCWTDDGDMAGPLGIALFIDRHHQASAIGELLGFPSGRHRCPAFLRLSPPSQ